MTLDLLDIVLILAIVVVAVLGGVSTWYRRSHEPPYPTWVQVASVAGWPVLALIAVAGVARRTGRQSAPEVGQVGPADDPRDEIASRDQQRRLDEIDRESERIENDATDDEVAGRGALLFDPGTEE